jgi:hypothetical protein
MYDVRPLIEQVNDPVPGLDRVLATHPAVVELQRRVDILVDAIHEAARAAADAAEAGIGLYREYVDMHDYPEDRAATSAIAEVREGTDAITAVPGRLDSLAYATQFTFGGGTDPVHAEQRGPDAWVIRRRDLLLAGDEWVEDQPEARQDEAYLTATRHRRGDALREAASVARELTNADPGR